MAILAESQKELKRWMGVCLLMLAVASFPDLVLRAQMMSRKPIVEVIPILRLVISRTHIGHVWFLRICLIAGIGTLWFAIKDQPRRYLLLTIEMAAAMLLLTLTLSGHSADQGNVSWIVLFDWLHIFVISVWLGGLPNLLGLTLRTVGTQDKNTRIQLVTDILNRFSSFAYLCVVLLVTSGTYLSFSRLRALSNLFGSPYGLTLVFKITFFILVLTLGALIRYYVRPSFQRLAGQAAPESRFSGIVRKFISRLGGRPGSTDNIFLRSGFRSEQMARIHLKLLISVQCLIAIIILGIATLLTQTSPPMPENTLQEHSMHMNHTGM